MTATPQPLSPPAFSLAEVFEAYHECRRHKRNKPSAVAFELDLEHSLIELCAELNAGSWVPAPTNVFIVETPVKREVFAAGFRDRVVHHVLIRRLNPLFEREFIYDSYSCRVGKGTHLGIARLQRFLRRESSNPPCDPWVLRLDIQGFFMNIQRTKLLNLLEDFLNRTYRGDDLKLILQLLRNLILADPTRDCRRQSPLSSWDNLPADKSLFKVPSGCGLPIGNLTSQVLANFYLSGLDHYVKHTLGIASYGRYVDDLFLVHRDHEVLVTATAAIRNFLHDRLALTLHPRKIRLARASVGVAFLGAFVRPDRLYPSRRLRSNFRQAIDRHNLVVARRPPKREQKAAFLASMNSYLGILRHSRSWRFRTEEVASRISPHWKRRFVLVPDATKVRKV
ncbi:MAG: RNA-directed DNA polymerase [Spirochaetales bacterium]